MSFKIICNKCGSDWTRIYTLLNTDYKRFSTKLIFKEYNTYIDCKNCGQEEKIDGFKYE